MTVSEGQSLYEYLICARVRCEALIALRTGLSNRLVALAYIKV